MREQLSVESTRLRETQETSQCRIRAEECQRILTEEKLEKACAEMSQMRDEHLCLSDYLVRLARALCWSDCIDPPAHGGETHSLSESLLERAEGLAIHTEHDCEKACYDLPPPHHHHHNLPKLRRERSCHDIPLKEVCSLNDGKTAAEIHFILISISELNGLLSAKKSSRVARTGSKA
jgi:hypothetical protein